MISNTKTHRSDQLKLVHILHEETQPKILVKDELAKKWESTMFESDQPAKNYVVKNVCRDMNLGDDNTPRIIKVYEKLTDDEWNFGEISLKRTLKSLHGRKKI